MRRLLASGALLLLACPALARSPYRRLAAPVSLDSTAERLWELELRPGFSVPRGSLAQIAKNSATLQVSVERKFGDHLSAGLEVGDNLGHRYEGNDGRSGAFTSDIRIGIFQLAPMVKLGLDIPVAYHSLRPYFVAGCGLYLENRSDGTVTFRPSGAQRNVEASKAHGNVGVNGGAGITYRPAERIRLGAETRYHYYSHDGDIDGDGVKRDNVYFLTTSFIVSWLF